MAAYHRPTTLQDALAVCAAGPVTVLAGGTDVLPARAARAAWRGAPGDDVLDITAVPGLRRIVERETDHRIGCLTTWSDIVNAELPSWFAVLQQAGRDIGGPQIQNRATLAGNLCTASPAADGAAALLALDAYVELCSATRQRVVSLEDFFIGYRQTARRDDEILTAIYVPKLWSGARSAFCKLGARRHLVISIVMAAAVIAPSPDGRVVAARVAVGACSAVVQRLPLLEARLIGRRFNADLADLASDEQFTMLSPVDDMRASADYRRAAAIELVRDVLTAAARAAAP